MGHYFGIKIINPVYHSSDCCNARCYRWPQIIVRDEYEMLHEAVSSGHVRPCQLCSRPEMCQYTVKVNEIVRTVSLNPVEVTFMRVMGYLCRNEGYTANGAVKMLELSARRVHFLAKRLYGMGLLTLTWYRSNHGRKCYRKTRLFTPHGAAIYQLMRYNDAKKIAPLDSPRELFKKIV